MMPTPGQLLLWSFALPMAGGIAALILASFPRLARSLGAVSMAVGALAGLYPALHVFFGGGPLGIGTWSWLPYGTVTLAIDPLSAFFLLPIFLIGGLGGLYGAEYLAGDDGRRNVGAAAFHYNLLVVGMAAVVTVRQVIPFLVAWELMSLAAFFLVLHDDDNAEARGAGLTYLLAAHFGTAFLFFFFLGLAHKAGTMEFGAWHDLVLSDRTRAGLFLCALIGFGTKAGFLPLHVWLPEAHPAAPSHVSAVMSGVMVKMGIYGLLRTILWLGSPSAWWGGLLLAIGLAGGIGGLLFALAQQDLKRMLAYSTIENLGIIAMGIGLGLLGRVWGAPFLAACGFGAALWHVFGHSMAKGLLFFGAGSVVHAAHTRDLNRLGGLFRRQPVTGTGFLLGAVAIAGLPPLGGFVGEFLLLVGCLHGLLTLPGYAALPLLLAITGLALIAGLATAAFTRTFGLTFLGEPRTEAAGRAHDPGWRMQLPLVALTVGCLALALMATLFLPRLDPLAALLMGPVTGPLSPLFLTVRDLAGALTRTGGIFLGLLLALALIRKTLLSGRRQELTGTWDCGYAAPTARMQYSPSSFAQPLTDVFAFFLRGRREEPEITGILPAPSGFSSHSPDVCKEEGFRPVFARVARWAWQLHWLQSGRIQVYVLYIALTLIALLVWNLW